MPIKLLNCHDGITVYHSLFLIRGLIDPPCCCHQIHISVVTQDYVKENPNGHFAPFPSGPGLFKVLCPLHVGDNHVRLVCCHYRVELNLIRALACSSTPVIQPLYIVTRSETGESDSARGQFQGPPEEDTSLQSALKRLTLALQLAQCFFYESLAEWGYENRTFILPPESACVAVHETALSRSQALCMSPEEIWVHVGKELMRQRHHRQTGGETQLVKWVGCLAFTRYLEVTTTQELPQNDHEVLQRTRGHCSLGAGDFALLGSGNLFTWPSSLEEVWSRWSDVRQVDRMRFMDHSAFRGSHWANYATGLGALLHEMGHIFGLGHSNTGIMNRGGDDIHKFFAFSVNSENAPATSTNCTANRVLENQRYRRHLLRNRNLVHSQSSSPVCSCNALWTVNFEGVADFIDFPRDAWWNEKEADWLAEHPWMRPLA